MNFEPQKFFIGLIDFFSILLPGALFTYLFKDYLGLWFLGSEYKQIAGTEGGVVFLFSSYLLGHFIFLLGSWLDELYDAIRKATHSEQIKRLARSEKLSARWSRLLAGFFFKKDVDRSVNLAVRIKEHYLNPLQAASAVNAFQWCKARLTLEHPEAIATIQRFEADSKFFRSLLVVLCVIFPWSLLVNRPVIAFVSVPVLLLAFWRYVDQRLKATNQAYWYIITLESQKKDGYRHQTETTNKDGLSHAGGVVFRRNKNQVEYLLVQASNVPNEWVLPKGHIELEERPQETAVREVREETGVWAAIKRELKRVSFKVDEKSVKIQFYLMEATEEGKTSEKRKSVWLPLDKALEKATHNETRDLLKFVEQKIPAT